MGFSQVLNATPLELQRGAAAGDVADGVLSPTREGPELRGGFGLLGHHACSFAQNRMGWMGPLGSEPQGDRVPLFRSVWEI